MSGPRPPSDLATRTARCLDLAAGTVLHRFWTLREDAKRYEPIYYDRSLRGRLNAPDGGYGMLYAAQEPFGAFAESFLRSPGRRTVDPKLLANKAYVRLRLLRPLRVIDFDGPNLSVLGATAEVVHGGLPYDDPQAWSKALRDHPVAANGLAYTARHDPSQLCYALFEDGDPQVEEVDREETLDADWFWNLAERYELGLAPV